ncbi:sialidase family protein [Singulisphaera rosea]
MKSSCPTTIMSIDSRPARRVLSSWSLAMTHDRFRFCLALALSTALNGVGLGAWANEPVRVDSEGGPDQEAKQPQVTVDAKGRIFVVFGRGDTVRLAVSDDRGKTFTTSTVGSPGVLALGMRRGPRVVATENSVTITAIGGAQGKGRDGDVSSWRSTDLGKTWSGPNRVNTVAGSAREGLHGMAAGPGGRVFCTWLDLRNGRMEIFGARSEDDGATWKPDALVYRSSGKSVCECCHPSAAFGPDGTLYVMWRNSLNGSRDHYIARSTDEGRSFHAAEKLGPPDEADLVFRVVREDFGEPCEQAFVQGFQLAAADLEVVQQERRRTALVARFERLNPPFDSRHRPTPSFSPSPATPDRAPIRRQKNICERSRDVVKVIGPNTAAGRDLCRRLREKQCTCEYSDSDVRRAGLLLIPWGDSRKNRDSSLKTTGSCPIDLLEIHHEGTKAQRKHGGIPRGSFLPGSSLCDSVPLWCGVAAMGNERETRARKVSAERESRRCVRGR